jgi:hypothetical protein
MNNRQGNVKFVLAAVLVMGLVAITPARAQTAIGGNLQVFSDMSLIESLTNAVLKQHESGQRPNGTGSVNAGYTGGEMITKPITFTGRRLVLNYATSAAGSIRVEIQDSNGVPKTGYALANFPERYLDEVEGVMKWGSVVDVGSLAGTTIRLRFVLKDADLYAMRFANPDNVQYSVSYNANGASGGTAPATQQKEKGVSLVLAMNAGDPLLYKTGHTFAGWNTAADGSGTSYAECATYTNDAALTLHARWAANPTTYTVSFNKNGATSGFGPAALNKIQGVGLTLPSSITLAKTGYTFSGWNTAAAGNGTDYAVGASYTTDSAITLYAKWVGLTDAPTILAGPEVITGRASLRKDLHGSLPAPRARPEELERTEPLRRLRASLCRAGRIVPVFLPGHGPADRTEQSSSCEVHAAHRRVCLRSCSVSGGRAIDEAPDIRGQLSGDQLRHLCVRRSAHRGAER